jgi:hypothetical protein
MRRTSQAILRVTQESCGVDEITEFSEASIGNKSKRGLERSTTSTDGETIVG